MKIPTVKFQKSFVFWLSILSLHAALAQTVFVGFKSTGWKYRTSATFGNGTWKTNAYNDAAWASGQATLGYDDGAPSHTRYCTNAVGFSQFKYYVYHQ